MSKRVHVETPPVSVSLLHQLPVAIIQVVLCEFLGATLAPHIEPLMRVGRATTSVMRKFYCVHCGVLVHAGFGVREVTHDGRLRHMNPEQCPYPNGLDPFRFIYSHVPWLKSNVFAAGGWATFLHFREHRRYIQPWRVGGEVSERDLDLWFVKWPPPAPVGTGLAWRKYGGNDDDERSYDWACDLAMHTAVFDGKDIGREETYHKDLYNTPFIRIEEGRLNETGSAVLRDAVDTPALKRPENRKIRASVVTVNTPRFKFIDRSHIRRALFDESGGRRALSLASAPCLDWPHIDQKTSTVTIDMIGTHGNTYTIGGLLDRFDLPCCRVAFQFVEGKARWNIDPTHRAPTKAAIDARLEQPESRDNVLGTLTLKRAQKYHARGYADDTGWCECMLHTAADAVVIRLV